MTERNIVKEPASASRARRAAKGLAQLFHSVFARKDDIPFISRFPEAMQEEIRKGAAIPVKYSGPFFTGNRADLQRISDELDARTAERLANGPVTLEQQMQDLQDSLFPGALGIMPARPGTEK